MQRAKYGRITPGRLAALCVAVLATPLAHADDSTQSAQAGLSGTAALGPIVFPRYSGSRQTQVWAIPLLSANYKDIVYVEPLRAGAYFWGNADKSMGLGVAVEPRLGFKAGDAARLTGMDTRRDSLEGGPAFDWDLGPVALSASLFTDLTHSSRGGSARFYALRPVAKNETWDVSAYVGAERLGKRVANYFFGVRDTEATPERPAYQANATTNLTGGIGGTRRLGSDYALLFGLQSTRLAGGLAHSPIVDTRLSTVGWIGLGLSL